MSRLAINFCHDHNIVMVGFQSHTTHRLQQLDFYLFGPLKIFYSQACDNFMVFHPGQAITDSEVGQLFCTASLRAATLANAIKLLKACVIEPYKPQIFTEEYYAHLIKLNEISFEQDLNTINKLPLGMDDRKLQLGKIFISRKLFPNLEHPGSKATQKLFLLNKRLSVLLNLMGMQQCNTNKAYRATGQVNLEYFNTLPTANRPRATKLKRPILHHSSNEHTSERLSHEKRLR
ncbi:hypothetical protein PR048_013561 [Dryococelus australis]|uniref:Uncharacterized protein n=1 Tax=Dryococelus australis TaxID=614101 RepID=A0ABQ9HTD8_9NEOP|nr:hypothetical protein PR048_013561 [Dryococelus australis]